MAAGNRVIAPIIAMNSYPRPANAEAFGQHARPFEARIVPDTGRLLMWDTPDQFKRVLGENVRELGNEPTRDWILRTLT